MQLFADDLAFLCRELQLEKPVVIGHSMGGVVAFAFAESHPDLPSAIVTVDAGLAPPSDGRDGARRISSMGYAGRIIARCSATTPTPSCFCPPTTLSGGRIFFQS